MTASSYDSGLDPEERKILRDKEQEQEEYIQDQIDKRIIPPNLNGKAKKKKQQQQTQQSTILEEQKIPFTEWSIKLIEKYTSLQKVILDLIPELWEPTEFALSVRTILRIKNITLP